MAKKAKETQMNLYYIDYDGQVPKSKKSDEMQKKKAKDRERRIKETNRKKIEDEFDLETETVIQMTNKNKIRK